tara:strand:- start:147 stop:707 length:561 start_codon:yes stop_codon:yes gene_type:complete
MPSVIQADLLKDASATKTLATLSSSAVTLHSDVTFPANILKKVYCSSGMETMVDTDVSPSNILGSGGAGIQPTISSSGNDVLIFCNGRVRRDHGTTSYDFNLYISGGSFGTGLVSGDEAATASASTLLATELCQNSASNEFVSFGFTILDTAPGSTTPTYKLIRVGTPSIDYYFLDVRLSMFEVYA